MRFARGLKSGRVLPVEYLRWVMGGPPPAAERRARVIAGWVRRTPLPAL